ncbi:MAG: reverse transcriptase domain-containing protein, partial [Candidatus Thiodiazotropha sp.]
MGRSNDQSNNASKNDFSRAGITQLKLLSLNVCGLAARLRCPEFNDLLQTYDIIALQESKTDETDNIILPGYVYVSNNRFKLSRYRSGGIVLLVKENISKYINTEKVSASKLILWFTISGKITCFNEDIHCGVVYIPPVSSKYAHDEPFTELEREILRYCSDSKHILLMGDFNARTGIKNDYVQADRFLSRHCGFEQIVDEGTEILNNFNISHTSLARQNDDLVTNCYGNQMIDFCKNTNLFILNGRLGATENNKRYTCKDRSTVDYFLSTSEMFRILSNLNVHDFDSLYSDAHCALSVNVIALDGNVSCRCKHTSVAKMRKTKLWDPRKAESFVDNLDRDSLSNIISKLTLLSESNVKEQNDIDAIVNDIGNLFEISAKSTFGLVRPCGGSSREHNKPWFNSECRTARDFYHRIRRQYNKNKSEYNKLLLKQVSKNYKSTISKSVKHYKDINIKKLRKLKNTDPKEYWKILNSNQPKKNIEAGLEDLYNHFKNINKSDHSNGGSSEPTNNETIHPVNEQINQPITETEIKEAINALRNDKSSGLDNIKNEHIKFSSQIMLPIYCKLFNIIFETGLIPESWSVGTIKPIFKNKGDPKSPENYRPITILSCFGKLFTSVVNKRLNKYAEEVELIEDCQAGFRKNHSTTDNIFIIKSLIDIAKSSKTNLHCCFIDFKQAFDTVWRDHLWQKLAKHRINGKCLTLLQNMYKNIKSNITVDNNSSAFFLCQTGVRQGENISPFLFSIFLNDLEMYLLSQNVQGVTCDINYDEISVYLKLLVLLFADDTVLF